jgi:hypothetical protein
MRCCIVSRAGWTNLVANRWPTEGRTRWMSGAVGAELRGANQVYNQPPLVV